MMTISLNMEKLEFKSIVSDVFGELSFLQLDFGKK